MDVALTESCIALVRSLSISLISLSIWFSPTAVSGSLRRRSNRFFSKVPTALPASARRAFSSLVRMDWSVWA